MVRTDDGAIPSADEVGDMKMTQTSEMEPEGIGQPDDSVELSGHVVNLFHDDEPDSWLAVVSDMPGIMAQAGTKDAAIAHLTDTLRYATAS